MGVLCHAQMRGRQAARADFRVLIAAAAYRFPKPRIQVCLEFSTKEDSRVSAPHPATHHVHALSHYGYRCAGAPIATGRTGEPDAPCERSGKIIVQDSQTLSRAKAPRLAFWMLWIPATVRLW